MLLAIDFMMTQDYRQVVIAAPNTIDGEQWRATIITEGGTYTGYAENGHEAFVNAIRRYRDTNQNCDIPRQMDKGPQWASTETSHLDVITSTPFGNGCEI